MRTLHTVECDHKWWIGKDLEGDGSGIFHCSIKAFAWRDSGKSWNDSRYPVTILGLDPDISWEQTTHRGRGLDGNYSSASRSHGISPRKRAAGIQWIRIGLGVVDLIPKITASVTNRTQPCQSVYSSLVTASSLLTVSYQCQGIVCLLATNFSNTSRGWNVNFLFQSKLWKLKPVPNLHAVFRRS